MTNLLSHPNEGVEAPMPLYYAQFVILEENLWMRSNAPYDVIREETIYRIQTQLFTAIDAEGAYSRAIEMMGGLGDSHCDGPGDRTNFKCIGIYDLDEVHLDELHGVDAGVVRMDGGIPTIPSRNALSIFSNFTS